MEQRFTKSNYEIVNDLFFLCGKCCQIVCKIFKVTKSDFSHSHKKSCTKNNKKYSTTRTIPLFLYIYTILFYIT